MSLFFSSLTYNRVIIHYTSAIIHIHPAAGANSAKGGRKIDSPFHKKNYENVSTAPSSNKNLAYVNLIFENQSVKKDQNDPTKTKSMVAAAAAYLLHWILVVHLINFIYKFVRSKCSFLRWIDANHHQLRNVFVVVWLLLFPANVAGAMVQKQQSQDGSRENSNHDANDGVSMMIDNKLNKQLKENMSTSMVQRMVVEGGTTSSFVTVVGTQGFHHRRRLTTGILYKQRTSGFCGDSGGGWNYITSIAV